MCYRSTHNGAAFPPKRLQSWAGAALCSLVAPSHHPALVVEERVEALRRWAEALLAMPQARARLDVQAFFLGPPTEHVSGPA